MTAAADRILSRLEGVRDRGPHQWVALCPAHADKNPSLSVREVLTPQGEGRVRLHCFAGCEDLDVLQSVGLGVRDLFDNPRGEVSYVYMDLEEQVNRKVSRRVRPDGSKTFHQSGHQGHPPILYRLPEVVAGIEAGRPVYLMEGEADVDLAFQEGLIATSSPQGASSWRKADYSPLKDASQVVIVQDKDAAGRKRGSGLYEHLHDLFPNLDVRLVEPKTEGKTDYTDHVLAGFTATDLLPVPLPEQGEEQAQEGLEPRTKDRAGRMSSPERRAVLTAAKTVRIHRQDFLLDPLVPLETITVISGRGGEGKSTLALHWAALATRGQLPGHFFGRPINVAVSAHEDTKSVQAARLVAAGADMDRIFFLDVHEGDAENPLEVGIKFPLDRHRVEDALKVADAKLWIIDPVLRLVEGKQERSQDIREGLEPLHALAARLGIAALGIAHFNKGEGRSGSKLSGSHAIRDVIRSHIPLVLDEESGNRVYTLEKSNYSDQRGQSWQFDLLGRDVPTDDGSLLSVGVVQDLGESPVSVDQIINRTPDRGDEEDRNAAQTFLLDYLTEQGGEAIAGDVIKAARAAGFNEGEIKDARRRSRDPKISTRKSGGKGGKWVWAVATFDFPAPSSRKVGPETVKVATGATSKGDPATFTDQIGTFPRDSNENLKVASGADSATLEVSDAPTSTQTKASVKWRKGIRLQPSAGTQERLGVPV